MRWALYSGRQCLGRSVYSIFISTGRSLSCACVYYFNNVDLGYIPEECTADQVCHNATVCYAQLEYGGRGTRLSYSCFIESQHGLSLTATACTTEDRPGSVLECCNDTDYCNLQLHPTPPSTAAMSSPEPTMKSTVIPTHFNSEHKEKEGGREGHF